MSREIVQSVFNEFGKVVGIPDLQMDERGYCCIFFDDTGVNLEYDEETNELFMYSNVGDIPPKAVRKEIYEMLLEANMYQAYSGGGVLSIDKNNDIIVLINTVPAETLDLKKFEDALQRFIELTETWEKNIQEAIHTSGGGEEVSPPDSGIKG